MKILRNAKEESLFLRLRTQKLQPEVFYKKKSQIPQLNIYVGVSFK